MPLRIVKQPVQVYRNGQFVGIEPSAEPQEFSTDEVASIQSANPDALGKVVTEDAPKSKAVEKAA